MDINVIVRTLVLILALVNQCLTMAGMSPLPIDDELLTELITGIFTIGASLWAWWKNNSVTEAAKAADKVKNAIKSGKVNTETVDNLIEQ